MSAKRALAVRRRLIAFFDKRQIYPRRRTNMDTVCLAMFGRMAETHKSICELAGHGAIRDSVILGRTLCEAALTIRWLTNSEGEERLDPFVKFWGQVRRTNMRLTKKYFNYNHSPTDPTERNMLEQAKGLFRENAKQWSDVKVSRMAGEPDMYDQGNLFPQYELFYYWFSLESHPSIIAVEAFLPFSGEPFSSSKVPHEFRTIAGATVVYLSTLWLWTIAWRIARVLKLSNLGEIDEIFRLLSTRRKSAGVGRKSRKGG
jgi:Family of unknown function (DUF5677)